MTQLNVPTYYYYGNFLFSIFVICIKYIVFTNFILLFFIPKLFYFIFSLLKCFIIIESQYNIYEYKRQDSCLLPALQKLRLLVLVKSVSFNSFMSFKSGGGLN